MATPKKSSKPASKPAAKTAAKTTSSKVASGKKAYHSDAAATKKRG